MSDEDNGTTYYISADGQVYNNPQEAVDQSQLFESTSGQYVTGGNCPQDSSNISTDESTDKS